MVAFFHHLLGTMLRKLAIFKAGKYVHSTIFCTTSNENLNTRLDMLHITTLFVGKSKNAWSKSSKNLLNRIDNMEQVFQGSARFCMGAMLMKMQIFKKGSWVCKDATFCGLYVVTLFTRSEPEQAGAACSGSLPHFRSYV